MPAICDSISTKLSENLSQSFKKTEKENFEHHLTPTAKQILSAKIEYEPAANYSNSILNSLQTKYIVLKPNQSALSSNGECADCANSISFSSSWCWVEFVSRFVRGARQTLPPRIAVFSFATFTDIFSFALTHLNASQWPLLLPRVSLLLHAAHTTTILCFSLKERCFGYFFRQKRRNYMWLTTFFLTGNTPKSQQNGKHHSGSSSTSSPTQLPQPKRILFPRESVQVGWNHIGRWSSGCGFNNIGNTCYLNSALQAFFHVPALAHWLVSDNIHREKCLSKLHKISIEFMFTIILSFSSLSK